MALSHLEFFSTGAWLKRISDEGTAEHLLLDRLDVPVPNDVIEGLRLPVTQAKLPLAFECFSDFMICYEKIRTMQMLNRCVAGSDVAGSDVAGSEVAGCDVAGSDVLYDREEDASVLAGSDVSNLSNREDGASDLDSNRSSYSNTSTLSKVSSIREASRIPSHLKRQFPNVNLGSLSLVVHLQKKLI